MLSLDTFVFPPSAEGLRWSDEFGWSATSQATDYSLTGALLVQEATRQAGRPCTLTGGIRRAWLTRAQLLTLHALLEATDERTLTLHDGRQLPVIPARDGAGPISADSLLEVADPSGTTTYYLESLRFLIVGPIVAG